MVLSSLFRLELQLIPHCAHPENHHQRRAHRLRKEAGHYLFMDSIFHLLSAWVCGEIFLGGYMHMIRRRLLFASLLLALGVPLFAAPAQQAKERERQVKLEGQGNFRDLGGYRTADGRTVKWRLIYRAGQLNKLSDADIAKLKELNIRTVVDLRGTSEAETRGKDRLPEGVRSMSLPIDTGSLPKEEITDSAPGGSSPARTDFMLQATRSIMVNRTDVYSALIRELADAKNRPFVFHCTAGKDRTGVGAAVILSLLGVPWETVRDDYVLSNFYRKEENERDLKSMREDIAKKQGIPPEQVDMTIYEAMFLVKPEYIEAAHDEVIRRYGSMDSYLRKGLGISDEVINKLRSELLE
jgi:protein-tyrosine phosphatase